MKCGKCMLELSARMGVGWRTKPHSQKWYWTESWEGWRKQPQAFQAEGVWRQSFDHLKNCKQFIIAGMKRRRRWGEQIGWKSRLRQSLTGLVCRATRLESIQKAKGNHLRKQEVACLYLQFRRITGSMLENLFIGGRKAEWSRRVGKFQQLLRE